MEYDPRAPSATFPPRSGRTTPRETALGRHPSERRFQETLRPDDSRYRRKRPASVGPKYKPPPPSEAQVKAAAQNYAEGADDGGWRAGSYRYANAHFYDTLRNWPRCLDVKETTRDDWRVSAEDPLGLSAAEAGHDQSSNDADGWKRSSPVWVESSFRGGLRDYKGADVGVNSQGGSTEAPGSKDRKQAPGTNLGSIYRSTKQANVLSTARADEHFLGSLRAAPKKSTADYQARRRANLNLPQFQALSAEQVTKAKRIFASIDLDGSGSIDADEMRKFLTSLGHKPTDKAVKKLLSAADEGVSDSKAQLEEFCRLYHGMKL